MCYTNKLSSSVFSGFPEVGHDEWPGNKEVGNDLNQRRHSQFICDDSAAETGSQHLPVTVFCPIWANDDRFDHREGIEAAKHWRRHFLKTSFQQAQLKDWVVNESLIVTVVQVIPIYLRKNLRPSRNDNCERWIVTDGSNHRSNSRLFAGSTAIKPVQNTNGNATEIVSVPCP